MTGRSDRMTDKPTYFVVACSDARLSSRDGDAWYERAGIEGDVYEVRQPGGALVLAEPLNIFAQSVIDSFTMLNAAKTFDHVVLTCHEDCAYYRMRYGLGDVPAKEEGEAHQRLMRFACERIETAFPTARVREVYIATRDDSAYVAGTSAAHDDSPGPAQAEMDSAATLPEREPAELDQGERAPDADYVLTQLAPIVEELPADEAEQTLYEALLNSTPAETDASQGPGYSEFAHQLVEARKVRERTREFLEIVRAEAGVRSEAELRKLGATFMSAYGKGRLSQSRKRSLLDAINFKNK